MDEATWKMHVEQRKKRRQRERMGMIGFLALAAAAIICYMFYISSPEYAMKNLFDGIKERDIDTIEKYADIEKITAHGYDDLTWDLFAHDEKLTDDTKVMFEKFYVKIKPQVVDGTCNLIRDYLNKGQWGTPEADNILKGRQLGIDYDYLLDRSQLMNIELLEVMETEKEGNTASGSVKVMDTTTQTVYTLRTRLEKNQNGDWQVTAVTNYRDYLNLVTPIQNSDIAKYSSDTQDIIDKYNNIFDTQQTRFMTLTRSSSGNLSKEQRDSLIAYVNSDIIPALEARQRELNTVEASGAAKHMKELRQQSSELAVESWKHYVKGLEEGSSSEINQSTALRKRMLNIDRLIDDIRKHSVTSDKSQVI